MKFLFISLILLIAYEVDCLKSNDMCKNTDEICTGSFNSEFVYLLSCKKAKCTGPYTHSCSSQNYFTTSQETCQQFLKFRDLINSMVRVPNGHLRKFYEGIQKCPALNHNFNANEACMTGQNCYMSEKSIKTSKFYSGEVNYSTKKIVCPCRKSPFTFQCGDRFCTTNNLACDALLNSAKSKATLENVQNCSNDNLLIQKINF